MIKDEIYGALEYIGVKAEDFDLKDEYFTAQAQAKHAMHGKAHIYRVMIAAALLAKRIGEPRLGLLGFCAAFLHDQAREDNYGDYGHGWRAAMYCFPKFEALWDKYGLSAEEREHVRAACADHCRGPKHQFRKNRTVRHLLKDADALDRVRFGAYGLDTKYLHLGEASLGLIGTMKRICEPTNHTFSHPITLHEFISSIHENSK